MAIESHKKILGIIKTIEFTVSPMIKRLVLSTLLVPLTLSSPVLSQTDYARLMETGSYRMAASQCQALYPHSLFTQDGKCVDLSVLIPANNKYDMTRYPVINEMLYMNKKAGVTVNIPQQGVPCQTKEGLMGFYSPVESSLNICEGAFENFRQLQSTVVHESWHTVQVCMLEKNVQILSKTDPETFKHIYANSINEDLLTVLYLYNDDEKIGELEARYMEKRPDIVWAGLEICSYQR